MAEKLLYSEAEAAPMIHTTPEGLRYLRRNSRGPKFFRRGRRIFYLHTDLVEYVEELRRNHRGGVAS